MPSSYSSSVWKRHYDLVRLERPKERVADFYSTNEIKNGLVKKPNKTYLMRYLFDSIVLKQSETRFYNI